jgi:hypothetical protein
MASIYGTANNDTLYGADDRLEEYIDIDYIWGQDGDDVIYPGEGTNFAYGDDGNDRIYGGSGRDILLGDGVVDSGKGTDVLFGNGGPDELLGGRSRDFLIGGADDDLLSGGSGSDIFGFEGFSTDGIDTIKDFEITRDFIVVDVNSGSLYANAGLTPDATITADQFRLGTAAVDASDRFIYDETSGQLFFDPDGTGSAPQIQFATLESRPTISYGNIYVSQNQMPEQQIVGTASNNRADLYGEWRNVSGDISYYDAYTGSYLGLRGIAVTYTFNPNGTYTSSVLSLDVGTNIWIQTIGRYTLDANNVLTMTPVSKTTKGTAGGQTFDRVETTGLTVDHRLWVQGNHSLGRYTVFESLTLQPDGTYQPTDPDTLLSYYFLKGGPHDVELPGVTPGSNSGTNFAGTNGDDRITGGAGNDRVLGMAGNDMIAAGAGNDVIKSGTGNDRIWSGAGNDAIWSGTGRDVIALERGVGRDVIRDYSDRIDKLGLTPGLGQLSFRQQGNNLLISAGADQLAVLVGVHKKQISRADFVQISAGF